MPMDFTSRRAGAAAITALTVLAVAPAARAAAPASWVVDPAASHLGFAGKVSGDGFAGQFRRWSAQIVFDPKALAASKVVASIDVASAVSGDADRDQAMPTDDWFAAAHFPKAVFASRGFKDLGGGHYQALGDLTLRGVTHPIVLPFTLAISGDTAHMNGAVALNRTAFGVGQGQWKTGETVDTQVTVTLDLTARRAH